MARNGDDGQDKRSGDTRTPGNWMWYLALIAVLLLTVSVFIVDSTTKQILYPDLITLLKNTRYTDRYSDRLVDGYSGKVLVPLGGKPDRTEVSKPNDVRVDKTVVYGQMTYRMIDNGGNETQAP